MSAPSLSSSSHLSFVCTPPVWDEALKITDQDQDFHRKDLWEVIRNGAPPKWNFSIQIVPEQDEHNFEFDILDATKLWPEDVIPVCYIRELELSRNVDNYFSQIEQAAFCTSHIVLGIDFSNDPLLPSHNFSCFDTQTCCLSINWKELSIRRPVRSVLNNQDGTICHTIHKGTVNYWPNRLEANPPAPPAPPVPPTTQGGFISYPEKESDIKAHMLSAKSKERLFQARLFYNSRSPMEKTHPTHAYSFKLDHCDNSIGYNGMAERLAGIGLGARAGGCGEDWSAYPKKQLRANPGRKANGLSQLEYMPEKPMIKSRRTVILIADSYPVWYEGVKATVKAQGTLHFAISPLRQRDRGSRPRVATTKHTRQ